MRPQAAPGRCPRLGRRPGAVAPDVSPMVPAPPQSDRATMSPADWAHAYAGADWRVFPVVPSGKKPAYKGWRRDATTDPELITRHWRRQPSPNVGVVAGEAFDAWDIEAPHLPALREHLRTGVHALPLTPVARSGRGGIHILTQPTGVDRSRDLFLNGVHIGELKSTGGFIVACPSVTEGPYSWLRLPVGLAVAPAPLWLLDLLDRPRLEPPLRRPTARRWDVARSLDALAVAVRDAGEGRRNRYLYWATCRAIEEGVPETVAVAVMTRAALAAGLDRTEIEATIRSAMQRRDVS